MTTKDFYIDTHYICGVKTADNIFDLPEAFFSAEDFLQFEKAIKEYIKFADKSILHLWPWLWQTSELTDEVYIYEIESNRLLYYTKEMNEFFDANLIRKEQTLQGCEIFDVEFKFPRMLNNMNPITTEKRRIQNG